MAALLEVDQVRPVHPAALTETIVRKAGGFASAPYPRGEQRQRGVPKEILKVSDCTHVAGYYYVACYVVKACD